MPGPPCVYWWQNPPCLDFMKIYSGGNLGQKDDLASASSLMIQLPSLSLIPDWISEFWCVQQFLRGSDIGNETYSSIVSGWGGRYADLDELDLIRTQFFSIAKDSSMTRIFWRTKLKAGVRWQGGMPNTQHSTCVTLTYARWSPRVWQSSASLGLVRGSQLVLCGPKSQAIYGTFCRCLFAGCPARALPVSGKRNIYSLVAR